MLAAAAVQAAEEIVVAAWIPQPVGQLGVLLACLALVLGMAQHPRTARLFRYVPPLIFCYFIPTLLTTLGVIPAKSELYDWIKAHVLPASLMLLLLSLDVPGILRLGPRPIITMLAGTVGVLVGGPIALAIGQPYLEADAWKGMAAIAGSWIGGGANFVAIGQMAGASDEMLGQMIIADVFAANVWMACLLYASTIERRIDRFTGADASSIEDLKQRMIAFQQQTRRIATLPDYLLILTIGFIASYACTQSGIELERIVAEQPGLRWIEESLDRTAWKFILITSIGVGLSFTRLRNLDGVGASRVGTVMIYLLVACIGASADFRGILQVPMLIAVCMIWIGIHAVILVFTAYVIKAPVFFAAVGSQANIGGAASAPIVASAFHPSLAPVGALLAVLGYALGTYAGVLCMNLMKWVADAHAS